MADALAHMAQAPAWDASADELTVFRDVFTALAVVAALRAISSFCWNDDDAGSDSDEDDEGVDGDTSADADDASAGQPVYQIKLKPN